MAEVTLEVARRQAEEYRRLKAASDRLPELEAEQAERERLAALQEQLEAAEADLAARAERHRLAMHRSNTRLTGCLRELANILGERKRIDSASLYRQAMGVADLRYRASGGKSRQDNAIELQTILRGEGEQLLIDFDVWPLEVYTPPGDVHLPEIIETLDKNLPIRLPAKEPAWAEIIGHDGRTYREQIA